MNVNPERNAIAVIGMAGLFPQARSVDEFWNHILSQTDCIEDAPISRWDRNDYYDANPSTPDKTYCYRGGFIPPVDFDPLEFGIPPRTLEAIDTAQLLSLIVARDALNDAGYGGDREFDRERTGVILGIAGTTMKLQAPLRSRLDLPLWEKILRSDGIPSERIEAILGRARNAYIDWTEDSFPGMLANVVAGRIANRLNLGGINCAVDAACASTLCACNFAVGALTSGDCEMVITGGVDLDNSIQAFMSFSKTPVLSPTQCIRPFDADANGTVISEAIGMIVLKRLEDAIRDHDKIYAVICGIGFSSDGRCESIYAPRAEGQMRALRQAYLRAKVPASSIGLIEAHATGTRVGDAVEFRALNEVFTAAGAKRGTIALGSAKSQFGHAKAAAGAISLIKTILALHHKVLPPTIHLACVNPVLELEQGAFYFNTETRPWLRRADAAPRRAGVSAFGFGGANYHMVIEEAQPEHTTPYRFHKMPRVAFLSASSSAELARHCGEAARRIEESPDAITLLDWSADTILSAGTPRLGFAFRTHGEAIKYLQMSARLLAEQPEADAWSHPDGITYRRASLAGAVVAVFPGQGAQYLNMGRQLAIDDPGYRTLLGEADECLCANDHIPLSEVVFPKPGESSERSNLEPTLSHTLYAQMSVAVLSMALWAHLKRAGLHPDYSLGHSLGELTALWSAEAVSDGDFLKMVCARGEAFSAPSDRDAGALTAVAADAHAVQSVLSGLSGVLIANINAPDQTVVGGTIPDLEAAERRLEQQGFALNRLRVSAGFHTPCIEFGRVPWIQALENIELKTPIRPVYSNTTGLPHEPLPTALKQTLVRHPLEPVRFVECVEGLYAQGARIFVEIGPQAIVSRLIDRILGQRPHIVVATNRHRDGDSSLLLQQAIAQLLVAGVPVLAQDPYLRAEPLRPAAKRGISISLEASNYLSPETQARQHQALALQPTNVPPSSAQSMGASLHNSHSAKRETMFHPSTPYDRNGAPAEAEQPSLRSTVPADSSILAHVYQIESAVLDVHRQFLAQQSEQVGLLAQLAGHPPATHEAIEARERTLQRIIDYQHDTLRVHEAYLQSQTQISRTMVGIPGGMPTETAPPALQNGHNGSGRELRSAAVAAGFETSSPPIVAPPTTPSAPLPVEPVPSAALLPTDTASQDKAILETTPDLKVQLLAIVSERTGYPADLIDLDHNLEADLGIDSIKRIEILSILSSIGSDTIDRNRLVELRTLREILAVLAPEPTGRTGPATPPTERTGAHQEPLEGGIGIVSLDPVRSDVSIALPAGHVVIVGGDGTPLTETLAAYLQRSGHRVVVLEPLQTRSATSETPEEVRFVALESLEEEAISSALQQIETQIGPIGAFIHLHPASEIRAGADGITSRHLLKYVLMAARHLQHNLQAAAQYGRPAFILAARLDGSLGLSGAQTVDPWLGGLFGLAKSLRHEWPNIFCRAIDLGADDDVDRSATRIIAEILDSDAHLAETGYGHSERVTLAKVPLAQRAHRAHSIPSDAVFVVTGGARGITAQCVIGMAREFGGRYLLLGRTELDALEPDWARDCIDPSELKARLIRAVRSEEGALTLRQIDQRLVCLQQQREARATISAIQHAGGRAEYRCVDIADRYALQAALQFAGKIDGLMHGAGVVADSRIEHKTGAEFERVFRPKVDGLENVLAALEGQNLQYLLLFSSTAAVFGNAGQTDYAMANEILNKMAFRLRQERPYCRVASLCWGPWEGGMVTEELARRFQARGVRTIPIDTGVRFLLEQITREPEDAVQLIFGAPLPELPSSHVRSELDGVAVVSTARLTPAISKEAI